MASKAYKLEKINRRFRAYLELDDFILATVVVIMMVVALVLSLANISDYYLGFLADIFIFAIFGLGYNLLHGHTGLISFGHAGFFLVGAYAGALSLLYLADNAWLALATSLVVSAVYSLLVGFASVRIKGVYFALLTLAFSIIPYIAVRGPLSSVTGGVRGLQFPVAPNFVFDLTDQRQFFFFAIIAFVIVYVIKRFILRSSYGDCLRGIKDNEIKLEGLGYNTQRIKYLAVTISGTISGFAGFLQLLHSRAIAPEIGNYFISAKVIFASLIGGIGSIIGPLLGSFFWFLVEQFLVRPGFLEIILGAALIIVVLRLPSGFYSLIKKILKIT